MSYLLNKLTLFNSILFFFITPFNPRWSFQKFDKSNKKTASIVISFLLGLIVLAIAYSPKNVSSNYIPPQYESYVVGFLLGFTIRNLIVGYLLWLSINRTMMGKMSFSNSFAIVSFSQLPLLVGHILPLLFLEINDIANYIGFAWSAVIMVIGLKFYNDISISKSVLIVSAIFLTFILVTLAISGIKL